MSDVLEDVKEEIRVNVEDGDHDLFAHYCKKTDIEKSMFTGVSIRALCGKLWRPSKDFTKYPVCPECKEIWESLIPE